MAEKKKVLHIAEAMGGGVFTFIVELANGMCDKFDVTIAMGIRKETPEDYASYFDPRIKLIQVENFGRSVNPFKDFKALGELKKIIKDEKPDIIHTHSSKAGALGRLFISKKNIKMFYTPHGYSFLMQDVSDMKKRIYKSIEKMCGRRKCMTVACGKSEWEAGKAVSKNSTYISNGINMQKMDDIIKNVETKDHPFTVFTIGRIGYQKNPELFNSIAEKFPDIPFLWIGDGDMRDKITSPNIEITGWVNHSQVVEYAYQRGDLFLLPSRWEGLPISVLEAMYMKKACVVSNVEGNRDVIVNGRTGYSCNRFEDYIEAIDKLSKQMDETMLEQAYKDITLYYNSEYLCKQYEELYLG